MELRIGFLIRIQFTLSNCKNHVRSKWNSLSERVIFMKHYILFLWTISCCIQTWFASLYRSAILRRNDIWKRCQQNKYTVQKVPSWLLVNQLKKKHEYNMSTEKRRWENYCSQNEAKLLLQNVFFSYLCCFKVSLFSQKLDVSTRTG